MAATIRQKACIPCASSKRRCDKQAPECQRCLDRDVDCAWPQPKRRRRDRPVEEMAPQELPLSEGFPSTQTLGDIFDFENWPGIAGTDLDVSLADEIMPYSPSLSVPAPVLDSSTDNATSQVGPILQRPWFLQDETWVKQLKNQDPVCKTFASLEPFLDSIRDILDSWVKNGHSMIMHHRLYEYGLPPCLQEAYTTLASYNNRTKVMTPTILQIADERATSLVRQDIPKKGGYEGLLDHLAHTQALFVYQFIRLFDGSIRYRASAERQIPVLRYWVTRTCEMAKTYQHEGFLDAKGFDSATTQFDREYEISTKLWRLWMLTESIRRTQVVVDIVMNIYQLMVHGWADCTGAVMLTARAGLWEADSASKWLKLSRDKTPLLVPSMQPGKYLSEYNSSEFDEFIHMLWKFIVGPDKIHYWIGKSGSALEA